MHIYRTILLSVLVVLSVNISFAQCKAKSLVKENKSKLGDYKYDSYALNEIIYGEKKEKIEIEFSCYAGLEYKIIFCTSKLTQNIGITIYDKPKTSKKRTVLYFDESGKDSYFATFSPSKTGTYFIEYEVPPAAQPKDKSKGCVVILIGMKQKVHEKK